MSKVLKVVAIVASIAAAVATAGISLGISAALLSGIGVAASLGASLLASKPKAPRASAADRDRLFASINPRAPRTMVFGRTAMATDIRDQEFTGANKDFLHRFIVVASHKCQAIEEIWFDDKLAWSGGAVQGEYAGYLTVTPILEGSAGNAINISARMGTTRRYTGCAYVYFRYKLTGNSKKSDSPFAQSIPTRLTIVGKGITCYDPRLDSTVGGSGTQRANDQSTWVWSDSASRNTKLQELTYLLGWRINGKLAVGKGIPPARIDIASYITAANACDETVALAAGGSEPRYRTDGVISEADDMGVVLDQFKSSSNSLVDDADGKIRTLVLSNDLGSPVAAFTENDILGNVTWKPFSDLADRFNFVRGTYTDPSTNSLYQSVDYPEVSLANTDGIDRSYTVDFPMVQSSSQVQRLAKQRLQRAQYAGMLTCQMQATAWRVQKNDIVTLTFPALGFSNKLFRLVATSVRVDGIVDVVLREENAAIYAWDMGETAAVNAAAPTTYSYTDNPLYQDLATNPTYEVEAPGEAGGIGHLFIDGTGRKFRFAGGALTFGGDPILFNGDPISTSGYVDVQDQAVLAALETAQDAATSALIAQELAIDAQSQVAQSMAPNYVVPADHLGAVSAENLALVMWNPSVFKGGVSIKTDDETHYILSETYGGRFAVSNTDGASDKGLITQSAITANEAGGNLTVNVNGVNGPKLPFKVTKDPAPPPAPSAGTDSKSWASGEFLSLSISSYVVVSSVKTLALATGQTLYGSGPINYSVGGSGYVARSMTIKWQYSVAGANSWNDFAAGIVGATAYSASNSGDPPENGYVDVDQSKSGLAAGNYDVRLVALLNASGRSVSLSGSALMEAKV